MQLTELPFTLDAETCSPDKHTRSKGLHLGQIIDDVEQLLYPRKTSWEGEEAMALGFIWERVLGYSFIQGHLNTGRIVRPGELQLDGVYLTPDGYDTQDHVLEEWKCAWKSSNTDPESKKFWRYWTQVKSYCLALKTNKARLRVLFVNGDYKFKKGPVTKCWEAEFSDRELKDNWSMLTNHAKKKGWL